MKRELLGKLELDTKGSIADLSTGEFARQAHGPYCEVLAVAYLEHFGKVNKNFVDLSPAFKEKLLLAYEGRPDTGLEPRGGDNFIPTLNKVCETWERRADQLQKLQWVAEKRGLQAPTKEDLPSVQALLTYVTQSLKDNVDATTTVARFVGGLEAGMLSLFEALRRPIFYKHRLNRNWLIEHLQLLPHEAIWLTNLHYNQITAIPKHAIELYDGTGGVSHHDYNYVVAETRTVLKKILMISLDLACSVATSSAPDPTKQRRFGNLNF